MAAQHTPGPWEATNRAGYHEILAHDDGCDWYGRPDRHAVAYIDTEIEEFEAEANARLIAAGPEMAEALQELYDLAKIAIGGIEWHFSDQPIAKKTKAILAKIGGAA